MPGYGFSGKPTTTGWVRRVSHAPGRADEAPRYKQYVAQGGDWGAVVVDEQGVQAPAGLLAFTPTWPVSFQRTSMRQLFGSAGASGLSADEKLAYERVQFVYQKGVAYGYQMGLRPQTLYGIADSPVALRRTSSITTHAATR